MTNRSGAILGAPPRVNVLLLNLASTRNRVRGNPMISPRTSRGPIPWLPTELHRPTPEQFLNLIRRQTRGRLKVYLGSAAGVGKTYAMLREGHRLKAQGVDVVIGLVETHGRAETAGADRRPRDHPAARRRVPRRDAPRDGRRRDPGAPADGLPGRRAGPHQRPGLAATPSATRTSKTCSTREFTSSRR